MTLRGLLSASLLFGLAAGMPAVASAQIPDSVVPLRTVINETNRFRAEYAEYYNAKDVEKLVGMYDANAVVILDTGEQLTGIAAIKAHMTKMAPNFPHIVITSDTLIAYGPTAIDVGTTKQHPASGGEMVGKYMVVLRRHLGVWKLMRVSVTPVQKM